MGVGGGSGGLSCVSAGGLLVVGFNGHAGVSEPRWLGFERRVGGRGTTRGEVRWPSCSYTQYTRWQYVRVLGGGGVPSAEGERYRHPSGVYTSRLSRIGDPWANPFRARPQLRSLSTAVRVFSRGPLSRTRQRPLPRASPPPRRQGGPERGAQPDPPPRHQHVRNRLRAACCMHE